MSLAKSESDEQRFIVIHDAQSIRDRCNQKIARSYGVKKSMRERSKRLASQLSNFRVVTPREFERHGRRQRTRASTPSSIPEEITPSALDPFDSLPVDAVPLSRLMQHAGARAALEPVFSISDHAALQSFRSIFPAGFADPLLMNATMMTLTFADAGYQLSSECLSYRGGVFAEINKAFSKTCHGSTECLIGAILLLIGIDWRMGASSSIELHLKGILRLILLRDASRGAIHPGVRRAVFWQDLVASWTTGSRRVFDHTCFPELDWKRDPFTSSLYTLPDGLEPYRGLLGERLVVIFEDIHALAQSRESSTAACGDTISMLSVDNQQACIESRLQKCLQDTDNADDMLASCIIGAYLCTYTLFAEVWESQWIPVYSTEKLLAALQSIPRFSWEHVQDLILWLIVLGGTFSASPTSRSGYAVLLHSHPNVPTSWEKLERGLQRFIWSPKTFGARGRFFWGSVRPT